jgi:NADH-quinone oxidoreductase subunit L
LNQTVYIWGTSGSTTLAVGFLIDQLTVLMMSIVTFVSLLVHIYSIGYMEGDPGVQRFFSYMSLFTFGMLSLVMANNFLLLFFGWETVGLVSYLLIGFWFKKDSAALGGFKAFIVNRVGDFGFLLGIAVILSYFGTLDYATVFATAPKLVGSTLALIPNMNWSVLTVICLLLFVGAMGKSAQLPLHIWLPESMEGPTPISALIHAATMVTAGVYMVARMSPLYNLSPTAMSVVMIVGATGAFSLGLLAVVENDIKRVIAFSTMSQLGYMMAANGAGAYEAGIFHLATHACFKALLFLAAGSVIIAMHHEQNLHKMGNLRKYMPITYVTFLIGTLAITAIPPFAGFFSKDSIIEAVYESHVSGAFFAYCCLLMSAFVTALYSFRALFLAFHTSERMDEETRHHLHETAPVITVPLIILAIPSVFLGIILVGPMLFTQPGLMGQSMPVTPELNVLAELAKEYHGPWIMVFHGLLGLTFWFTMAGITTAWYCYIKNPAIPALMAQRFSTLRYVLIKRYGFDAFNELVFVRGTQKLSDFFYYFADAKVIDSWLVNGSGRGVKRVAAVVRQLQSGYLYHYAFAMIIGIVALLLWLVFYV